MSTKDLVDNHPPNGVVSQTRAFAPLSFLTSLVPRFIVSILNMPRSIWRVLPFQDPPSDPPDPPLSLPHNSLNRLSTHSLTSLTSSRPAPPSPAVSRRTSGLSRPSSRPTSGTVVSLAVMTTTPRHLPADKVPTPSTNTPALIHIRDYAFELSDPRFTGQGPLVPRPNRPAVLARRLASSTSASTPTSSTADDDDDWEDDDDRTGIDAMHSMWEHAIDDSTNGWGGFKWGFGRGWFGPDTATAAFSAAGFPSRGDFDRNFGGDDDDIEMDDDEAFEEGEVDPEGEPPLFPGLYRALYAFEPEGTAEMKLDEDQLVRVIGRGGGVGWAVVAKDGLRDTGAHALVPESYLEVVRLDSEVDSER